MRDDESILAGDDPGGERRIPVGTIGTGAEVDSGRVIVDMH